MGLIFKITYETPNALVLLNCKKNQNSLKT